MRQQVPSDRKASRAFRLGVGALASILACSQLGGAAHFLLVRHETCPEHGELLHSQVRSATHHAVSGRAPGVSNSEEGTGALEHEHCSVFHHQRARAVETPASRPVALLAPAAPSAVPVSRPVTFAIALYLVAPKNSPPSC